jgi:hypothetical protein
MLESRLRTGSRPLIISSFYVWFTCRFSGFPIMSLNVYNGVCMSSSFKKSYKLGGFIGVSDVVLCHSGASVCTAWESLS